MAKIWDEMTPDERTEKTLHSWISQESIVFASPDCKKAYRERATRIIEAIQLKTPDRVPFWLQDHCYFPCRYTGITYEEAVHNPEIWFEKNKKTFLYFDPDMFFNPGFSIRNSGQTQAALDTKNFNWPGHGVGANSPHQYVEGEYMKEDEYDAFIHDHGDFTVRTWLPRVYGNLEPLATLPPLDTLGLGLPGISEMLIKPDLLNAFRSLYQAGLEATKWTTAAAAFVKEMKSLGYPLLIGGGGLVPFDYISDFFRGMRGTMLDMYRRPDKLLEAMDMLMPKAIEMAMSGPKKTGNPGVFIALHRGSDGFMSLEQFETFYWPYLKRLMLVLIEEGLTPCPFLEGNFTTRLKYFAELPRGKVLALMDGTDIYQAKEVLGDRVCMSGMMPVSLLQVGTPNKVKDYARKLIDVVGRDGGFIMGPRSVMDNADPELVKVWVDFTREYGNYSINSSMGT
jgi:uroporphyrinogen-III decarboxylase